MSYIGATNEPTARPKITWWQSGVETPHSIKANAKAADLREGGEVLRYQKQIRLILIKITDG